MGGHQQPEHQQPEADQVVPVLQVGHEGGLARCWLGEDGGVDPDRQVVVDDPGDTHDHQQHGHDEARGEQRPPDGIQEVLTGLGLGHLHSSTVYGLGDLGRWATGRGIP
jgi:hypothetical protein